MLSIKILPKAPEEVTTTWEGQSRQRLKQWALLEVDGLPTAFQVTREPGDALPPGDYTLAPESFGVMNGRLQLSRVVLVPVSARASAAVAKG